MKFSPDGLRLLRLQAGLSQAELGALLGAPQATVYRWEAGRSIPRPNYIGKLYKIANDRGITPQFLISDLPSTPMEQNRRPPKEPTTPKTKETPSAPTPTNSPIPKAQQAKIPPKQQPKPQPTHKTAPPKTAKDTKTKTQAKKKNQTPKAASKPTAKTAEASQPPLASPKPAPQPAPQATFIDPEELKKDLRKYFESELVKKVTKEVEKGLAKASENTQTEEETDLSVEIYRIDGLHAACLVTNSDEEVWWVAWRCAPGDEPTEDEIESLFEHNPELFVPYDAEPAEDEEED